MQELINQEQDEIKRGQKPDPEYLDIAIDNLENLFIRQYSNNSKKLPKAEQDARTSMRNNISTLESRIKYKLKQLQPKHSQQSLPQRV